MLIQREKTSRRIKYYYPAADKSLIGYSWCGEFDCENDFFIARADVAFTVAIHTLSGCGEAIINGKKYTLAKNTLALLCGADSYSYYPLDNEWRFRFVHLSGSSIASIISAITDARTYVFPFFDREGVFDAIISNAAEHANEKLASAAAYKLLLSAYYGEESKAENGMIKSIKTYIAKNLAADLSVATLASAAGLSRPYFTELFTRETGKSPSLYVTSERLKKAKELLYTTDKPVTEIAADCGYFDVSSFIRLFKRREGATPLALRKDKPLP